MINTIYSELPCSSWIFQYYCNIQEPLIGQKVKIKSVFNPTEKTPSMLIATYGESYTFKDF